MGVPTWITSKEGPWLSTNKNLETRSDQTDQTINYWSSLVSSEKQCPVPNILERPSENPVISNWEISCL